MADKNDAREWRIANAKGGRLESDGQFYYSESKVDAMLTAYAAAVTQERDALRRAIRWALGEEDDFAPRPEGAPAYWWRTELRSRAAAEESQPK